MWSCGCLGLAEMILSNDHTRISLQGFSISEDMDGKAPRDAELFIQKDWRPRLKKGGTVRAEFVDGSCVYNFDGVIRRIQYVVSRDETHVWLDDVRCVMGLAHATGLSG